MKRETTLSLVGKSTKNPTKLVNVSRLSNNRVKLNHLKIQIMNLFILPLIQEKWEILNQNICFIDKLRENIHLYENQFDDDNFIMYKELLNLFENILGMRLELEKLEKVVYNKDTNLSNIMFKLPLIRLKPEYEIYHLILGKPNIRNKEIYNLSIINDIQKLIQMNHLSFENIKKTIISKYNLYNL